MFFDTLLKGMSRDSNETEWITLEVLPPCDLFYCTYHFIHALMDNKNKCACKRWLFLWYAKCGFWPGEPKRDDRSYSYILDFYVVLLYIVEYGICYNAVYHMLCLQSQDLYHNTSESEKHTKIKNFIKDLLKNYTTKIMHYMVIFTL